MPPADAPANPSGDGFVGIEDINTVLVNWNAGTPPGEAPVITLEPASWVCLGLIVWGSPTRTRQIT